ncbi:BNR-4 repeat-containing protein [Algibacter pectinivorans]|uniref:BNR repeat-containing family member n=1 Tax=Algibacter pectinivorans TaxID=870482 RepID=A0A1I1R0S5_9FLAO|nr:BNR-4 repeat-containing protein [Algibacter pectinivorans]SFD27915.1 BNR repeat-containing family member [Algibacter pectinivorans]
MILNKLCFKILFISFCFLGCASKTKEAKASIEENHMVDYFADNGFGNAVAIVQHPSGVYHKGITYVAYQGTLEDPYVASYSHKTKEWQGPFKAGISEMGKDPNRKKKIDNHGKPAILIDDAGYIHIAYGGHGGAPADGKNPLGNHHYGKNLHVVSKKPLDISSWQTLDNISVFGTYSQFVKMDNGNIYLFYRHGAHRSDWVYQKSIDNGITFDAPVSFLKHKRLQSIEAEDSWYPWVSKGNGDDIIVAFDYHICRDSKNAQDARGHIPERHNLYYMVFSTKTGVWKNVKNERLEIPLTKEMADEHTLVREIAEDWTFQGIADVDPNGNPQVCVLVGPDIGENRSGPKRIQHFRWDGKMWLKSENKDLPRGNGDLEVKSSNEVSIYLESVTNEGVGEISRWDSFNGGASFKKGTVFLSRKNASFVISSLIDNPHPDARIIVGEKISGSDYRTMYLLGDNGPIKRDIDEAKILKD